jgi:hypothetical protein
MEMMDRVVIEACERWLTDFRVMPRRCCSSRSTARAEAHEALVNVSAISTLRRDRDPRPLTRRSARVSEPRKGAFTALASILPDYATTTAPVRRCLPEVLASIYERRRSRPRSSATSSMRDGWIHPCISTRHRGRAGMREELGGRIPALRRAGRNRSRARATAWHRKFPDGVQFRAEIASSTT